MAYTYDEFMDITSLYDLLQFCYEYDVDIGYSEEYIYSPETIREEIVEYARNYEWDRIYRLTADLPDEGSDDDEYYCDGDCEVITYDRVCELKDEALQLVRDDENWLEGDPEAPDEDDEEEDADDDYFYYGENTAQESVPQNEPVRAATMYGTVRYTANSAYDSDPVQFNVDDYIAIMKQ